MCHPECEGPSRDPPSRSFLALSTSLLALPPTPAQYAQASNLGPKEKFRVGANGRLILHYSVAAPVDMFVGPPSAQTHDSFSLVGWVDGVLRAAVVQSDVSPDQGEKQAKGDKIWTQLPPSKMHEFVAYHCVSSNIEEKI
jgi:hypothetical protein